MPQKWTVRTILLLKKPLADVSFSFFTIVLATLRTTVPGWQRSQNEFSYTETALRNTHEWITRSVQQNYNNFLLRQQIRFISI